MKKIKALVLFSGGLDSILAVKVLQEQNIEVEGITFESNFFGAEKAKISARDIGIKLHIIDISQDILDLVKNPLSGLGKAMNPCIDCHALMIRKAGEFIGDFSFLASGEVLGQRPFSQNKPALNRVVKLAGREILRPLSAKLLKETQIENSGLVNREKLLDISGRGREQQLSLAKKYKIKSFPTPSGGCLLTEVEFGKRLKELITKWPDCDIEDAEIIKNGRIFWANFKEKQTIVIIARDKNESQRLEKLARKGDNVVEIIGATGPTTLIRTKESREDFSIEENIFEIQIPAEPLNNNVFEKNFQNQKELLETICRLTGHYSPKLRGTKQKFEIKIIK